MIKDDAMAAININIELSYIF